MTISSWIKFWPSRAPWKGVCGRAKFLVPSYYSQRAVFASPLSAFFIFLVKFIFSCTFFLLMSVIYLANKDNY